MNIFDKKNEVKTSSKFWKSPKIGDKIQGTLIGKRIGFNQLANREQTLYDIQCSGERIEDGKVVKYNPGDIATIGGKPGIDMQMKYIRLGQIVGFEFTEIRPSKKKGQNAAHIIKVYANPSIVDEQWLSEHEEDVNAVPETSESGVPTIDLNDELDTAEEESTPEKETKIHDLAFLKLEDVTEENWRTKVMEKTGLAFLEVNYNAIIDKMSK